MEMHQVRYFLTVCETLNFTRAAEICNVAQPSLTKAIKNLEEELGGELIRRERSQSHSTDLGRLMKPHLEKIYAASEAAKADADGFHTMETASINLGVMSTIGPAKMINFIAKLRDDIPSLGLNIIEAPGKELLEQLLKGELDVGLIGLPNLPDRLDVIPLYKERYTIAFAEGHRFEKMDTVPIQELDGEDYLIRVHCEFSDHFKELGLYWTVKTNVRYRSEREDWVQAMVLARMGCSIMPEFMPDRSGLATRPVVDPSVSRTISLATVAGRRFSPTLNVMIRLARQYPWPGAV